jgi:D-arginine dehydrogenase
LPFDVVVLRWSEGRAVETADVVIAGAGFAGAATAYALVKRGIRGVVVLEREAIAGMHASGRNAALAFQALMDAAEARLAVEGARFIATPPEDFTDVTLLRRCGSLLLAGAKGVSRLRALEEATRPLGIAGEVVTAAEAGQRVSALVDAPFAAAFWNPSDGVVDIHALLQGYLAGARRAGARIEYGRVITAVRVSDGCVAQVDTSHGAIATRCVVNAGGAWAGEIGVLAGVGTRTLQPRRRHLFRTQIDARVDAGWPFVWHDDIEVYFRPESGGLLMSPCDATPHPPREPLVDSAVHDLLAEKTAQAFPALAAARVTSAWACLRTFARDERFVIGRDPEVGGLVWVAGLGGHGMTTSAAVGRLGAAAVCDEPAEELAYFSPQRLA